MKHFGDVARLALPDWPRLMDVELAASYLGIGRTTLLDLPIASKSIGRRKLYDRLDLDRFADALGDQPLPPHEAEKVADGVEKAFLEGRKKRRGG